MNKRSIKTELLYKLKSIDGNHDVLEDLALESVNIMLHFVTCASIAILSQNFQNVTKCHRYYLANQILSQKVTMSQAIHSLA